MMNADTFLQQGQDGIDLRQLFVLVREKIDGVRENFFDQTLLIVYGDDAKREDSFDG